MTTKEIMLKDLQLAIELYTEIHNRDFAKEMGNAAEAESAVQFVKKQLKKYRDYPDRNTGKFKYCNRYGRFGVKDCFPAEGRSRCLSEQI